MARKTSYTLNRGDSVKKSFNPPDVRDRIQKKAYELFEKRGYGHGNDFKDWIEAEKIVLSETKRT